MQRKFKINYIIVALFHQCLGVFLYQKSMNFKMLSRMKSSNDLFI